MFLIINKLDVDLLFIIINSIILKINNINIENNRSVIVIINNVFDLFTIDSISVTKKLIKAKILINILDIADFLNDLLLFKYLFSIILFNKYNLSFCFVDI